MKYIVPVMSGKGGVGKSTVAVNLAVSFANLGYKVGLIDADFYGPSIPTLMGGGGINIDHEDRLIPESRYGVKYVSIGFFLQDPDSPVVWRGPMFNKALNQLFNDVSWGEVDVCVVDMPPGTGDAQLSLAQLVKLSGAVVVTTPQEVALADVRKAIGMLAMVNVPVLGLIENMAGFVGADGKRVDIFGAGGGKRTAEKFQIPFLGSVAIDVAIREGGDAGEPIATHAGSPVAAQFMELARDIMTRLHESESKQPSLSIVN
jgi:ATP-binding protein involved in chromosome partitioning